MVTIEDAKPESRRTFGKLYSAWVGWIGVTIWAFLIVYNASGSSHVAPGPRTHAIALALSIVEAGLWAALLALPIAGLLRFAGTRAPGVNGPSLRSNVILFAITFAAWIVVFIFFA